MLVTTRLKPVGNATEVSIVATNVPAGIEQDAQIAALNSTLTNLERFVRQQ